MAAGLFIPDGWEAWLDGWALWIYVFGPLIIGLVLAVLMPFRWCVGLGAVAAIVLLVRDARASPPPAGINWDGLVAWYVGIQLVIWCLAAGMGQSIRRNLRTLRR